MAQKQDDFIADDFVADDFTPDVDPNAAIKAQQAAKYPTLSETGVTDNRTPAEVARDQALQAVYGGGRLIAGMPGAVMEGAGALKDMLTGKGSARMQGVVSDTAAGIVSPAITAGRGALGQPVSREEWEQAASGAGANLIGLVGPKAIKAGLKTAKAVIPSKVRAQAGFDRVMAAAKDVPIDTTLPDSVIQRINELDAAGSTIPKVLKKYIKRREAGEPITYKKGRDIASKAGQLSAKETMNIAKTPIVAELSKFAKAMKDANRGAAVKAGMGDIYDAAMKEYRQVKGLESKAAVLKKHMVRAAVSLGAGAAGAAVVNDLLRD